MTDQSGFIEKDLFGSAINENPPDKDIETIHRKATQKKNTRSSKGGPWKGKIIHLTLVIEESKENRQN